MKEYAFNLQHFAMESEDGKRLVVTRDSNEPEDGGNQYNITLDYESFDVAEFWFKNEAQAREFIERFTALVSNACGR